MTASEELRALLARVEAADGPDRELDAAIVALLLSAQTWSYNDNCHIDAQIRKGVWKGPREAHPDFSEAADRVVTWRFRIDHDPDDLSKAECGELPYATASIDAALALVERAMPGWWWAVGQALPGAAAKIGKTIFTEHWEGDAATPPLAIIAALLRAKIAETEAADAA